MIPHRKYCNTGFIIITILNVEIGQLLPVVMLNKYLIESLEMAFHTSKFEF